MLLTRVGMDTRFLGHWVTGSPDSQRPLGKQCCLASLWIFPLNPGLLDMDTSIVNFSARLGGVRALRNGLLLPPPLGKGTKASHPPLFQKMTLDLAHSI